MGTISINGKPFVGNNVTIHNGKVVIDGKAQDGQLEGDVEVQVVEDAFGSATSVASVTCGGMRGDVHAGTICAVAFASADNRSRKWKKR